MSHLTETLGAIKTHASSLQRLWSPRLCRVLIVDDEPSVRRFIDRVLSDAGFITSTASDGRDALMQFDENGPCDVLVTDLRMPIMDGTELARLIRARQPAVKVLYVTAYSEALFEHKPTLWADEAFLDKPCSPEGLVEGISLLVNGHVAQHPMWESRRPSSSTGIGVEGA